MRLEPACNVRKQLRLTTQYSSPDFDEKFGPVFEELVQMYNSDTITSDPQNVMLLLDKIGNGTAIPAGIYKTIMGEMLNGDTGPIDMLLQEKDIVEPTVVFQDDSHFYAGIVPDVPYSNEMIMGELLDPRSDTSFDLADPAAYARQLPSMDLYDLLLSRKGLHSGLVRILHAAKQLKPAADNGGHDSILDKYTARPHEQRMKDAKILSSVIYTYASNNSQLIRGVAHELSSNYVFLYDKPDDTPALEMLKKHLDLAAHRVACERMANLAGTVEAFILKRKQANEAAEDDAQRTEDELSGVFVVDIPGARRQYFKKD
ncbi:hypothetical protein ACFL96_13885 [Thermoproteota archaeon]